MTLSLIPAGTKEALDAYIKQRMRVGGFLQSVITNDLAGATLKADPYNRKALPEIVEYLRDNAPISAWGHETAYRDWIEG